MKRKRQKKARRIMLIAALRMSKHLGIKFNRNGMEDIRDKYILMHGLNSLVKRFDIASIVA
jgi:hypothetical protein